MKTTVEIPDVLFRHAKAAAARQGIPLREFITDAVRQRLRRQGKPGGGGYPWRETFGGLRDLHRENRRIDRVITREFERIDERLGYDRDTSNG